MPDPNKAVKHVTSPEANVPNFDDITDEGLQQFFDNEVDGSDGFSRLLEEGRNADKILPRGESAFEGIDPDLVESFKTLERNAELQGPAVPTLYGSMSRTDWSAEFRRLSREQKIKFLNGWNRQHPAVFAPPLDDQAGARGGWLTFRGKPSKWLVAVPVVILLVVGASILADGFLSSDEEALPGETIVTDTGATPGATDTGPEAQAEPEPEPSVESEPAAEPEPTPEPAAEPEPEPEPAAEPEVPANTGTYEVSARVAGACGSYDVFLRMILFLNGEMTVDQLLTAGGNPFQSALGRWDSQVAVATYAEASFFEAWFFIFNVGDLLSIYNVYGPSSPVITPSSEVNLDTYADVASAEQLDAATQGTETCPTELIIDEVTHTPFP